MIINELLVENPQIGDSIDLEFGDLLIETTIEDITEDGIVVNLDESAMRMVLAARKQYIAENKRSDPDAAHKFKQEKLDALPDTRSYTKKYQLLGLGNKVYGVYDSPEEAIAQRDKLKNQPDWKFISIQTVKKYNKEGVPEGKLKQLPTRGADYSQYDTDHLEMLLRPGILHRNELRFKNLIRKELEKRRQAKSVDPKDLIVSLADVPIKKPRGHTQYDPAKEFPGVKSFQKEDISEAEYQGRKVPLGKPMKGDVKKSKVYVKGPNGNIVKVNFGDKNMRIKKSNPNRRKSFRARHNCDNPGPRWKARYWSCRAW